MGRKRRRGQGGTEREREEWHKLRGWREFCGWGNKKGKPESKEFDVLLRRLQNKGNIVVSGRSQWKFDTCIKNKKKNPWKFLINDLLVQSHKAISAEKENKTQKVSATLDLVECCCRLSQITFIFLHCAGQIFFPSILCNCEYNGPPM